MRKRIVRWAGALGLLAVLASPALATGTWMAKCQASQGTCYGCCVLAYIEAAFFAAGGWD